MEVSGLLHTPATIPPRKEQPAGTEQEAGHHRQSAHFGEDKNLLHHQKLNPEPSSPQPSQYNSHAITGTGLYKTGHKK